MRVGKVEVVLRESDDLLIQIRDFVNYHQARSRATLERRWTPPSPKAEKRAMLLLHQIVSDHKRLELLDAETVLVNSVNTRAYIINLKTGFVQKRRSRPGRRICVHVYPDYTDEGALPWGDKLIALILTIAYAPHLICTL